MNRMLLSLRMLATRLAGKTVFESGHYRESELTRLLNLFAHVDVERWRGMRVLEVGAGLGRLGDVFVQLGFDVTSTDGREEYVNRMKARGRKAFVVDLDRTGVDAIGDFDLILAFGVVYHLREIEPFIRSCGVKSKVLLLETVVSDSAEAVNQQVAEAGGWRGQDQALNRYGCRPSPSWIEGVCRSAGFDVVRDISSPLANWQSASFDWEPRGNGEWRRDGMNLRKMWVCEKSISLSSHRTGDISR